MNRDVERALVGAQRRWRWLLFWRLMAWATVVACAWLAMLGGAALLGWVTEWSVAAMGVGVAVLFGALALVVAVIRAASASRTETWLAGRMEERFPKLMDRVNALADLRNRGTGGEFVPAIGEQAREQLARVESGAAISGRSTGAAVGVAALVVAATWVFFSQTQPWEKIGGGAPLVLEGPDDPFELDLPEDTSSQMRAPWGEVRITEPGGDLKLTKVDVLPLTVEAATNEALKRASWTTAVNGAEAEDREFPAPREPNYAVYEPLLYLDELAVDDWDVVSYSAAATAGESSRYASEIFFVEIRPFREELMKLEAGGGSGGGLACLKKLNRLIEKETDILRGTHRQTGRPAETTEEREQDQRKLVAAQDETRASTAHLYGEVAEIEHEDIGTVLDQLAKARETMGEAVANLETPDNPRALASEQLALQQLIESRKDLVKAIKNGAGGGGGGENEESQPVAGMEVQLGDKIADLVEFRDARAAAMEAVRSAKAAQEALAGEAKGAGSDDLPMLAEKQKEIAEALDRVRERAPEPFKAAEEIDRRVAAAMEKSEALMSVGQGRGANDALEAAERLGELEKSLVRQAGLQAVADVYRLKGVLEAAGEQLAGAGEQPDDAEKERMADTGEQIERAKEAMEETLGETEAGELFGPGLAEALGGKAGAKLEAAAGKLQEGKGEGAGEAGEALAELAKAFEASQPGTLRGAAGESLAGHQGVGDAARMLRGLAKRLAESRELSDEELRGQLNEARLALLDAEETSAVPQLAALARELEDLNGTVDLDIDELALRKLVDRLESYRLEMADLERDKPIDPTLLKYDPAEAPAEYRERVKRYFEKLSEG